MNAVGVSILADGECVARREISIGEFEHADGAQRHWGHIDVPDSSDSPVASYAIQVRTPDGKFHEEALDNKLCRDATDARIKFLITIPDPKDAHHG